MQNCCHKAVINLIEEEHECHLCDSEVHCRDLLGGITSLTKIYMSCVTVLVT